MGRGSHAHRGTYVVERTSFSIIIVAPPIAVEARGVDDDAEAEAAAARDSSGPPLGGTLDAANLDGTRDDELGPGCMDAMDEHHDDEDDEDDEDDDRAMPSSDAEVAARSFPSPEGVTASQLRDTSDGDTGIN